MVDGNDNQAVAILYMGGVEGDIGVGTVGALGAGVFLHQGTLYIEVFPIAGATAACSGGVFVGGDLVAGGEKN